MPTRTHNTNRIFNRNLHSLFFNTRFCRRQFLLFNNRQRNCTNTNTRQRNLPSQFRVRIQLILRFIRHRRTIPTFIIRIRARANRIQSRTLVARNRCTKVRQRALLRFQHAQQRARNFKRRFITIRRHNSKLNKRHTQLFEGAAFNIVRFNQIQRRRRFITVQDRRRHSPNIMNRLVGHRIVNTSFRHTSLNRLHIVRHGFNRQLRRLHRAATVRRRRGIFRTAVHPAPRHCIYQLVRRLLSRTILRLRIVFMGSPPRTTSRARTVNIHFMVRSRVFNRNFLRRERHRRIFKRLTRKVNFRRTIQTTRTRFIANRFRQQHFKFLRRPTRPHHRPNSRTRPSRRN